MLLIRYSLALLLGALVVACGILPDAGDGTRGWSAEKLYAEAKDNLNSRNYEQAIKFYEKLEARFPYGRYAQQAQLEIAYAYYKDNEPAQAVTAADRFIKLHPNHPSVDYAYYLKGLANFNEDLGWTGFIGGQDMTERDPKAAREAFEAFKELVTRVPDSRYAPDSIARMNYLVNALASHEIHVARYYMKRKAYIAAANRVQYALMTYPRAPANEEGLVIMVAAYDALGLKDLRDDAERVMRRNFADSELSERRSGQARNFVVAAGTGKRRLRRQSSRISIPKSQTNSNIQAPNCKRTFVLWCLGFGTVCYLVLPIWSLSLRWQIYPTARQTIPATIAAAAAAGAWRRPRRGVAFPSTPRPGCSPRAPARRSSPA